MLGGAAGQQSVEALGSVWTASERQSLTIISGLVYFGFMYSAELLWDGRPRELRLRVQQELWDVRAHRAKPSCIPMHDTFGVLDTVSGIKALVTKLLCKHQQTSSP